MSILRESDSAGNQKFKLTVLKSNTYPISKHFSVESKSIEKDNQIIVRSVLESKKGGDFSEGFAKALELDNIVEFGYLLGDTSVKDELSEEFKERLESNEIEMLNTPHHCGMAGVSKYDKVDVLSKSLSQKRDTQERIKIAKDPTYKKQTYVGRNKETFTYQNAPGLLVLDIDEYDDGYLEFDEIIERLYKALPELKNAPILAKPSTSSNIFCETDKELIDENDNVYNKKNEYGKIIINGTKGWHLFIPILSTIDIRRLKQVIAGRLWINGSGYYRVGDRLSEKCLIDLALFTSNQQFFFNANLETTNLIQEHGNFIYINKDKPIFNTLEILDLSETELSAYNAKRKELKNSKEMAQKAYDIKLNDRIINNSKMIKSIKGINDIENKKSDMRDSRKKLIRKERIDENCPIYIQSNNPEGYTEITIKDIMNNRQAYQGVYCASVINPFYLPGGKSSPNISDFTRARIWSDDIIPHIHDHASGGTRFLIDSLREEVMYKPTRRKENTNEIFDILIKAGNFYQKGGMPFLVELAKQNINQSDDDDKKVAQMYILDQTDFETELSEYISLQKFNKDNEKYESSIPSALSNACRNRSGRSKLPEIAGVTDIPFMDSNGNLFDENGYNPITKMYYYNKDHVFKVPENVTVEDMEEALHKVMRPFSKFEFDTRLDRANYLAAMLTVVLRPLFIASPTELHPAWFINSTMNRSGKTKLSECLSILMTGKKPSGNTFNAKEEENKKVIGGMFASAREFFFFDNLSHKYKLDSEILAMMLTSKTVSTRLLNDSKIYDFYNNSFVVVNGMNLHTTKELTERFYQIKLTPSTSTPARRKFSFVPENMVMYFRYEMLECLFILYRGFCQNSKNRNIYDFFGNNSVNISLDQVGTVDKTDGEVSSKSNTYQGFTATIGDCVSFINEEVVGKKKIGEMDGEDIVDYIYDTPNTIGTENATMEGNAKLEKILKVFNKCFKDGDKFTFKEMSNKSETIEIEGSEKTVFLFQKILEMNNISSARRFKAFLFKNGFDKLPIMIEHNDRKYDMMISTLDNGKNATKYLFSKKRV